MTTETQKNQEVQSGITFIIILLVTCTLVAFMFLVLANIAGAAVTSFLGIGAAVAAR